MGKVLMNQNNLEYLEKWFADYVAGFYTDNPMDNNTIHLKEKHAERVCENMILPGKVLYLTDGVMVLTETMALFHKFFVIYRTNKGEKYEKYRFAVDHRRSLVSATGVYPTEIGYFDMSSKCLSGDRK